MAKNGFFIFFIVVGLVFNTFTKLSAFADENEQKINWLTFEEAFELVEQEPKKIFVDIYTDWCGYCKRMDALTFQDSIIADIINNNYYPVKFNAEGSDPVVYRGVEYINENPGQRRSSHNFAIAVLQGKLAYPSFVFFDEELNLITAISGFRMPKNFEPILFFFLEDVYLENPDLDDFIRNFKSSFD